MVGFPAHGLMTSFHLLFPESGLWGPMVSPSHLQLVLLRCHLCGAAGEAAEELLLLWTVPVGQRLRVVFHEGVHVFVHTHSTNWTQ